jgi:hypothetical protein
VKSSYADGKLDFEASPKWAALIAALRAGIHSAARGEELPVLWNGMCPAGKHGLDSEDQPCDLCAAASSKTTKARKRP